MQNKPITIIMKRILLLLVVVAALTACTQNKKFANANDYQGIYELYPTQNIWTFIKLNTEDGRLWQVQYSVGEEDNSMEVVLNDKKLAENGRRGRFVLYQTQNMWNFILLDKETGATYQVQWNHDADKRIVLPIVSGKEQMYQEN